MTPQWAPWPAAARADEPLVDPRPPARSRVRAGRDQAAPPDLASPSQLAAACTLLPVPTSVRAGRDFTHAALRDWGLADLTPAAELVISELVTNAIRHGVPSARPAVAGHAVRLRLLAQGPLVMCMVSDPGAEIPIRRESGPSAENGRGLAVVESCCLRWGWHLLDDGCKEVWALLRPAS